MSSWSGSLQHAKKKKRPKVMCTFCGKHLALRDAKQHFKRHR